MSNGWGVRGSGWSYLRRPTDNKGRCSCFEFAYGFEVRSANQSSCAERLCRAEPRPRFLFGRPFPAEDTSKGYCVGSLRWEPDETSRSEQTFWTRRHSLQSLFLGWKWVSSVRDSRAADLIFARIARILGGTPECWQNR